jgi:hypothetical protein
VQALCRQLGALAPLPSLVHQLVHIVLTATREADAGPAGGGAAATVAPRPPQPPAGAVGGGASVAEGGAARVVVEAVGGAALPRAEALWVLDQVLLGAAAAEGGAGEAVGTAEAEAEVEAEASGEAAEEEEAEAEEGEAGEAEVEEVEEVKEGAQGRARSDSAATGAEAAVPAAETAAAAAHVVRLGEAEQAARAEAALMLLGELLRPGVWHGASVWRGGDGVAARRSALLERELLLQVTASAAALLHRPEDAQVAMRLSLFPMLEHLGDEATLLSSAAELSLCRLCRGAAHDAPLGSVRELLRRNGDYLLDAIAHRLRRAAWHPHTPQVVQAVLEYAGAETLPLMTDIAHELLTLLDDAVDASGGAAHLGLLGGVQAPAEPPALLPCLRATHALVLAARDLGTLETSGVAASAAGATGAAGAGAKPAEAKHAKVASGAAAVTGAEEGEEEGEEEDEEAGEGEDEEAGLAGFFDGLLRSAEDDEGVAPPEGLGKGKAAEWGAKESFKLPEAEEDAESRAAREEAEAQAAAMARAEDEEAEERRNTPPLGPALVLQVVGRAEVLLLSGSAAATHMLLGTLHEAIYILAPWPRTLLPALHRLWPSLFELIGGTDLAVAARAAALLRAAVRRLGGEISARSLRDALPPLLEALRRHGAPPAAPLPSTAPPPPAAAVPSPLSPAPQPPLSLAHRLVRSVLHALHALCGVPRALRPEALRLLRAATPLLSCRQPAALQRGALRLSRRVVCLNRDAAWLHWVRATPPPHWGRPPPGVERPAADCLPACPAPAADYAQNARLLLEAVRARDAELVRRALEAEPAV